jgi:O-antigen/teichoic acid export membrane protein
MALTKALFQNTLIRLLTTVVMFLTTVLLTRMVGASDFGVLSLMIANASLLNLISSLGISSGITYNLAAKSLHEHKILSVTFLLLLFQIFIISIFECGWFLFHHNFWILKGGTLMDFILGISFFISLSVIEKYNALYYGRQRYLLANNIVFWGNLAVLSSLFILLIRETENSYIFFIIYISGSIFQAIMLVATYHIKYIKPAFGAFLNQVEFKLFFSYSFLAFITNILQYLAYRADYWFVDYFKGSTQLGLYSVSVRVAQLFWIVPGLFAAIIFPKVASKQTEGNSHNFLALIRIMNTFNITAGLILYFFSPNLIVWIFGVEYSDSVTPFQILLPGVISFCITTVLASYFAGINKLKVNFWGTILCVLVILFLDFIFIPRLGIKGAAIASSIGYTLSTIYNIIMFKQLVKVRFSQLFLIGKEDLQYIRGLLRNYVKV